LVLTGFQSHIGAIRIRWPLRVTDLTSSDFNPTLVQLE